MKRFLMAGVLALAALAGTHNQASGHGGAVCYGCGWGYMPVYAWTWAPVCPPPVTFTLNINPHGDYVPMVPNGYGH